MSRHLMFAGVLIGLSLALHIRLLAQFDSAVASDLGDPLLNTWILWWNAHNVPFTSAYWNAPSFAPAPYALALSETLLGLTLVTSPLQWLGATPLEAYNALFIAMPVLNGMSAYWLCLTLTGRHDAAAIGGLAYAFAPYHASQLAHIQTEATFWMPIALVGLHRYWSTGGRRWLACFGAGVVLNALTCGYFLMFFTVLVTIAIAWLAVSSPSGARLRGVILAMVLAAVALLPVVMTYRAVRGAWNLHRGTEEIESFSADVLTIFIGSDRLFLWPIHAQPWQPEGGVYPQYPGVVVMMLLLAGLVVSRTTRRSLRPSSWRRRAIVSVSAVAAVSIVAGLAARYVSPWSIGVEPFRVSVSHAYKPIGLGLNLLLGAALLSSRFWGLVRSGSVPGLYATGAVAASILSLGPLGRFWGLRVWYKPPYAWLMALPGFDAVRVPGLFAAITVLCLAVLTAFAVTRLMPQTTRASLGAVTALGVLIVLDGWPVMPVVAVPRAMPVTLTSELVIELPTRGVYEDVAAMYRGMTHGRRVVNGYSGYTAPHYGFLKYDLNKTCLESLDEARGGRSMDVVIWRDEPEAYRLDAAAAARWKTALREESTDAIVYHVPRAARMKPSATDPVINLAPFCLATRPPAGH